MKPVSWSPSSLKMYEQCPRKYHEIKVLKNYKMMESEQQLYGKQLHDAADVYIKGGPLAGTFEFMRPIIDAALAKPHDTRYGEKKMALNEKLVPREFFDRDVWVRAIADLITIDSARKKARVVDWKTGSDKYPETDQLDIMALCVFEYYPQVDEVAAALVYVLKNGLKKAKYLRKDKDALWWRYRERVSRIVQAHQSNVWNPQRSGLCGWCEVTSCEMNPKG